MKSYRARGHGIVKKQKEEANFIFFRRANPFDLMKALYMLSWYVTAQNKLRGKTVN